MAKAKKITKEELENVKNLNNKANEIAVQIGSLEVQKDLLVKEFLSNNVLVDKAKNELQEKYGDVSIDLKDGSIKSIDEVENGK
jgi:3-methyladenine DNA glycosylase AlkD|tara:strand:+ start:1471 stop:1722 length:252 start_codon:yes stop_codon:yes gene_type:complete